MARPKKVAVGELVEVVNTKRKPAANRDYYAGFILLEAGKDGKSRVRVPVMFTKADLDRAVSRAGKNKEDQPDHAWIQELKDLVR